MATSFTQQLEAIQGATDAIVAARTMAQQAKAQLQTVAADLSAITANYGGAFTDIAADAVTFSTDPARLANAATATAITNEFSALQTVVNNTIAAATV